MKTLFTMLITLAFISFTNAQNSISENIFDEEIRFGIPDSSFKIQIPDFNYKSPSADSGISYRLPESEFQLKENYNFLYGNNYNAEFRMPVAGAQFNSKMPVMVPDSAVNYALKIKNIHISNPLYFEPDSNVK